MSSLYPQKRQRKTILDGVQPQFDPTGQIRPGVELAPYCTLEQGGDSTPVNLSLALDCQGEASASQAGHFWEKRGNSDSLVIRLTAGKI